MSFGGLVAYDSSDESEEEVNPENDWKKVENDKKTTISNFGMKNDVLRTEKSSKFAENKEEEEISPENGTEKVENDKKTTISNSGMKNDVLRTEKSSEFVEDKEEEEEETNLRNKSLLFNSLPKPKTFEDDEEIEEAPITISQGFPEISGKKEKGPVKISIPSLSEFKDVDEEMQQKKKKIQPSVAGTGLFSVLPPPSASLKSATALVPQVLSKQVPPKSLVPSHLKNPIKPPKSPENRSKKIVKSSSALISSKYDSNSEDEEEDKCTSSKTPLDFFSLSKSSETPIPDEAMAAHMLPAPVDEKKRSISHENPQKTDVFDENSILTSTVMNLPRDEIILKNKAEVGPKLPVPEQEYHVDADGNVAFDEKAIEYLCGKRGVKRKNELIQEANIIDINGEDIKPDEREWLVKALTEEQVQRPISLSAGPSGASKKKHQITYLAHQAKAMELELQNQWAANRLSRKQTKSKYGF